MGDTPVGAIDEALVLRALKPIWSTKPETASRVRGRIESILSSAAALKYRSGENPARWRGNLKHLLSDHKKVRAIQHHPALPYSDVSAFLVELGAREGTAARALEVTILTALRSGEVLGTRWPEIDLEAKVWTVPKDRMKGGREHKVPLSAPVVEIIESLTRVGEYVFAGSRPLRPLNVCFGTSPIQAARLRAKIGLAEFQSRAIVICGGCSSLAPWP